MYVRTYVLYIANFDFDNLTVAALATLAPPIIMYMPTLKPMIEGQIDQFLGIIALYSERHSLLS